jgi:hypothetical protein
MYTGRKKLSIKFALLKAKVHKLKRIRVGCCRAPILTGEAGFWAVSSNESLLHQIEIEEESS